MHKGKRTACVLTMMDRITPDQAMTVAATLAGDLKRFQHPVMGVCASQEDTDLIQAVKNCDEITLRQMEHFPQVRPEQLGIQNLRTKLHEVIENRTNLPKLTLIASSGGFAGSPAVHDPTTSRYLQ